MRTDLEFFFFYETNNRDSHENDRLNRLLFYATVEKSVDYTKVIR